MEVNRSTFNILTGKRPLGRLGHVARMEEGKSAFKIVAGNPTGTRILGRPRRR